MPHRNREERRTLIAEAEVRGATLEEINDIRFTPGVFNPALPTVCAAGGGRTATGYRTTPGRFNLDFSCAPPRQGQSISRAFESAGEHIQREIDSGEDSIQEELDGIEAEANRFDENLENIRDEAREGIGGFFSGLPGARFFRFLGIGILALFLVLLVRIIVGIFK